ncbi:23S rRNA (guanine(745)-N(1))-methyltransferase [Colwellia sp. 1_MG-2023]|jgi:23S rRNA (guanine745-N1)-methyltransferase|uniref:23S rRNA (guanine(745)-N(1))-methyltransferase n=1 Tax=unclassified Colwellia TaxID=196834 RepID=UPI001C09C969|nr:MULTISPECIES: 23S rRNA (guanine(745)-N(1))-methyltransferase [unclassified Colwellia]MBU2924698.1 23S rRNA (guanine(745)-N(1))-methyltransferase [Colwellia sp. C2M11]MDO6488410.1 23S rRNA (guanine(745)-N(1))-methyltransferase [Colwellia sp. 6_MG-2023]MDO6653534.1 23S rRNA (guanine(745)-N(1))-methyltransferase [Colwellia sp. 3_MG-2023]MDO6666365.1 23S rRNA (guanine(745)-N(1))-methyltransferase [Colwellia sp. 2_MG-2023]MDO6690821.1 23S rRNA (guanine(745)-N(1))-methyltransferase [Colwellia sp.
MSQLEKYLCPLCQQPLSLIGKTYCCDNKHSFDQAKQGYVNLLPVQFKHSKEPGDNKAMVVARRAFLDKGFYQPLVDKMLELYQQYGNTSAPLLDAGCGEGFYTHQHKNGTNNVYGVDIAKETIKIAAKRYKTCHFSVGTLSKLSFSDNYFAWLVSVYAPILETEFTRILSENGYLLTVTPAEKHLFELKELIYEQANQHDTSKSPIENLTLIEEQKLTYPMHFSSSEDVLNLLAMTPFAFKASKELMAQIKAMDQFTCQADFILRLYKK